MIRLKVKRAPGFGNLVSKSERKVRRKFNINKQQLNFYSHILNDSICIRGSAALMRLISAYGNIDRYLTMAKIIPELAYAQKLVYRALNRNYLKSTKLSS